MLAAGPEHDPHDGSGAVLPPPPPAAPRGARSSGTRAGPQYVEWIAESSSTNTQPRKCPQPSSSADGIEAARAGLAPIAIASKQTKAS